MKPGFTRGVMSTHRMTMTALPIIGHNFFHQLVNSGRYISNILNPFVAALTEKERTYSHFQQEGVTAHQTVDYIYTIFTPDRVGSRGQSGLGPS
ncbi:UNVERIFIED_CONTAM: hypothetical protein NCL1_40314 [Trichonephila clavipes]